jgi:hypothetical protein
VPMNSDANAHTEPTAVSATVKLPPDMAW